MSGARLGRPAVSGAVRIRPMRTRDVPAVAAIEQAVYPRPWSARTFRAELRRDDRIYLVAAPRPRLLPGGSGGHVRGYAGALVAADEAHVLTVAVHPDHRRTGTGLRLVLCLLGAIRGRGVEAATLEVRESNEAARALYERVGFVSSGVRPGYYEDNGEGAHILWLHGLATDEVAARLRDVASELGVPVPAGL